MSRTPVTGFATEESLIEQEISSTVSWFEQKLRLEVANALPICESPIERVLLTSLIACKEVYHTYDTVMIYGRARSGLPQIPFDGLHVYPQVSIDGYRLDFLAIYRFENDLIHTVIELDGHNFHERTKQQASHDKRRDRHFTKKGWQVLRYTGSDVWRSPSDCAREIIMTAQGLGEEA